MAVYCVLGERERRLFRDRTLEAARHRAVKPKSKGNSERACCGRGRPRRRRDWFQQISEILEVAGAEFVAPLPDEVQRITVFSAGVLTQGPEPRRGSGTD